MNVEPTNSLQVSSKKKRLPVWLRKSLAHGHQATNTDELLKDLRLNTICKSGKCPNRNECFSQKTATFMILGEQCTRNCLYCSVAPGKALKPEMDEPERVAEAVNRLKLDHVVITSVTRDDLDDEGVAHFASVIKKIRSTRPGIILEVLTPDFKRDMTRAAQVMSELPIDIFNHNIETVKEQHKRIRPQGNYHISLQLLKTMKQLNPKLIIKSGAMLGVGEVKVDVINLFNDLRSHGCEMLTLGQYLQPEKKAMPVTRYVDPKEFVMFKKIAINLGFLMVESGPFVRSSYHAKESFEQLKVHIKNRQRIQYNIG